MGHTKTTARIEQLFGEEVAVATIQVANRATWLDHDVESVKPVSYTHLVALGNFSQ